MPPYGLGAMLPPGSYAAQDASARALVELVRRDWALFKSGTEQGGEFDVFQQAVTDGWVPDTPDGYDTFMFGGGPDAVRVAPEFTGWKIAYRAGQAFRDRLLDAPHATAWAETTADNLARARGATAEEVRRLIGSINQWIGKFLPGQVLAPLTGPEETVRNEVTGGLVPRSQIIFYGELPDGTIKLQTAAGTWGWPGPNYRAPTAPATVTEMGGAAAYVLGNPVGHDRAGHVIYEPLAMQWTAHLSDSTNRVNRWRAYGAQISVEDLRAGVGNAVNLIPADSVHLWSELDAATQAAIRADIGRVPGPPPVAAETPGMSPAAGETPAILPASERKITYPTSTADLMVRSGIQPAPLVTNGQPVVAGMGTIGKVLLAGAAVAGIVALLGGGRRRRAKGYGRYVDR